MNNFNIVKIWMAQTRIGYSIDDSGQERKFGLPPQNYPDIDFDNLNFAQAMEIYNMDYWTAYRCQEIKLPAALFLFESLAQHDARVAVRMLQMTYNQQANGVMCNQTINTINKNYSSIYDLLHINICI